MSVGGCSVSAALRCRRHPRWTSPTSRSSPACIRVRENVSSTRRKKPRKSRNGGQQCRSTRSRPTVIDCLTGDPPADVLHFAVHGSYAPEGVLEGLILVDGDTLDPMAVKGMHVRPRAVRVPQRVPGRQQQRSARRLRRAWPRRSCTRARRRSSRRCGRSTTPRPRTSRCASTTASSTTVCRPLRSCATSAARSPGPDGDGAATRLAYQYFGHPALAVRVRHPTARREP